MTRTDGPVGRDRQTGTTGGTGTAAAGQRAMPGKRVRAALAARRPRLSRRSGVLGAVLAASLALVPSTAAHADGIRAQQWGLDAMHTQQAWRTTKGKGITVAVLDTGVDARHRDLAGNVLAGKDMVGFGASRGDRAWARHGTAMAASSPGTATERVTPTA